MDGMKLKRKPAQDWERKHRELEKPSPRLGFPSWRNPVFLWVAATFCADHSIMDYEACHRRNDRQ